MLHEMAARDIVPKLFIMQHESGAGAALANITMCDRFEEGNITKLIKTGQQLQIDPEAGIVRVISD